jgi:hypothetical protein
VRAPRIPKATYCVPQTVNSSFTKTTTAPFTFSGGVNISKLLGINLSAETGYSSTASSTPVFTTRTVDCGTHDYPGGDPRLLSAGGKK